ncbi:oxidoreductase, aldo/keto reductase family protein [Necator americanus]|uniref:Oxidoreductase, aldo/keto reductase family protein n=1 Tax=Necator americanus TaxID=51031 RepID=W2TEX2_NECAM|nr:oxidoreductase, aldo/keto reductase family protein [Necator americanus]ETN80363.1 oxidoreductase, aldo/keto reductase family protein [Necator americanus]
MTVGGPTITLSNGVKMPQVGLGTWQSSPAEVKGAVKAAIEAGYRLIDTAACYQNEGAIGDVIHELIQAGKVKREDLFITTKLWVTHLHPDDIESAIRESLRLLQLDYVDLYIPHMPTCFNVELHLYWPQHELHEICKKHNISITSYATLGSPGRVNFKLPSGVKLEWAPAPADMDDPNVKKLAEKYKKTPAQILLRYVMDRNIAVIPKSVNPSRIVENFQVFDFKLTPDEIKELETTPHRQRLFLQDFMEGHPEDAFASERKH